MYISNSTNRNKDIIFNFFIVALFAFLASYAVIALAEGGDAATSKTAINDVICRAIKEMTGTLGKSVATIVIISVGIMFFFGKITWGLFILVIVGMGITFGAQQVVDLLSGSSGSICP